MNCAKCGAPNAPSNKFCRSCGSRLVTPIPIAEEQNADIEPICQKQSMGDKNGISQGVRVFFAIIACAGIYLAYVIIGVILEWKRGGGAIPIMIMLSLMGFTWRAITGSKPK